jgi:hypothetical protein
MALTLTYSVTNLKVKDQVNSEGTTLSNAVCQTYWKVVGEDENGNQADWAGATPFTAENVPAASFISFDDLVEEDVLGWIKAVVDGDPTYKAHIIDQLQRKIDQDAARDATMPWAPDVTPPAPEAGEADPNVADPVDPEA